MRFTRFVAAAAALLLAVTSCRDASSGPSDPVDVLTADVAVVAGDAAFEDVNVIYTQLGAFGVPTGDIQRTGGWRGACPYDAPTGRFTCPPRTGENITITHSYGFRDAAGQPQSAYDATTTDTANFRSTMTGSVTRDRWSATIARERDITASGLAGAETQHTINGFGSSTESRSRHTDGGVRSYTMAATATFTNVVVPFPRSRGAWPLSGSITRQVTASRDGDGGSTAATRTATLTFNGTRFATLNVGNRTFTVDLASGRTVRRRER
jgi:hypothetical protein